MTSAPSHIPNAITLNAKQAAAAAAIEAMLARPAAAEKLLLLGYAGTGKTRTVAHALGPRRDVLFVTPSHKAKNVLLDMMPGGDVITVHRALGYKPHYVGGLQYFAPGNGPGIAEQIGEHRKRVIILDECSMVGGGIFEELLRQLGFIGEEGAATVYQRRIKEADMEQLGGKDAVVSAVWGAQVCPIDGAPVLGRPRFDAQSALCYRVAGPRVPVKLIVMGDPGQLPPVVGSVKVGSALLTRDPELVWCAANDHLIVKDGWVSADLKQSPTLNPRHYQEVHQLTELMRAGEEDLREHNLEARRGAEEGRPYKVKLSSANVTRVAVEDAVALAIESYKRGEDACVLAFRNAVCSDLNEQIRRGVIGEHVRRGQLYAGEPCDLHSPVQLPEAGVQLDNGDLVYTRSVTPHVWTETIGARVFSLTCARVAIKRQRDGLAGVVLWLAPDEQRDRDALAAQLDEEVERLEVAALGCADEEARRGMVAHGLLLDDLRRRLRYELFADLRPAYCKTVHKSQGGTWSKVYYHQGDVLTAPRSMCAKLAYVAISRAASKLIVAG